jgi:hypothetical protein
VDFEKYIPGAAKDWAYNDDPLSTGSSFQGQRFDTLTLDLQDLLDVDSE